MTTLPFSGCALVVRTDFSDDTAWERLVGRLDQVGDEGWCFEPVSDPAFSESAWDRVKAAVPRNDQGGRVVLIADTTALTDADHPLIVVDLLDFQDEHLEPFRCIATELSEVVVNLNIGNMDWEDFADSADDRRIFRGF